MKKVISIKYFLFDHLQTYTYTGEYQDIVFQFKEAKNMDIP